MKKVAILRFLTAVGAALTTLASLDLTGIAELFDDQVALYLLATGPAALSLKELVVSVGDWLDDGKPNKSFKIGLLCLLFLLIPLPFLGSCAPQPFSGGLVTEDGRFTLRPDGRIEVIIQPRTSK
jgi:hypothetical protein